MERDVVESEEERAEDVDVHEAGHGEAHGMQPATWPRDNPLAEKLLLVDPRRGTLADATVADLPGYLRKGDLVVLNDAATLPASLTARDPQGNSLEIRLLGEDSGTDLFRAVLFGAGDWHTPTEHRPAPPALTPGTLVTLGDGSLTARVASVSDISPRLVSLRFDAAGAQLWRALYQLGRPVQYSYLRGDLALWHVQTAYASRPWAAELPSAGRPLRWSLLLAMIRAGVRIATLTHAAGLSSTGDPALDAALPLRERYEIPAETVREVREARARNGRVIAVGTTVVRALEGCAREHDPSLREGPGETDLKLDAGFTPRVVDGLLTGMHEPTASHYRLLHAFAPAELLDRANAHAERAGYLCHEFGDSSLILAA